MWQDYSNIVYGWWILHHYKVIFFLAALTFFVVYYHHDSKKPLLDECGLCRTLTNIEALLKFKKRKKKILICRGCSPAATAQGFKQVLY